MKIRGEDIQKLYKHRMYFCKTEIMRATVTIATPPGKQMLILPSFSNSPQFEFEYSNYKILCHSPCALKPITPYTANAGHRQDP